MAERNWAREVKATMVTTIKRFGVELKFAVAFCTRLPIEIEAGNLAQASWAYPLAGAIVGLIGAAIYGMAWWLGLPAQISALLALAATMLATGALHEDGLADTVDGFGGGQTREQKLAILRDSNIGTYGVCALVVALALRWSALSRIAEPHAVASALVAAHVAARAAMPIFMRLVPPARPDGLSAQAGRPPWDRAGAAGALGVVGLLLFLGPAATAISLCLLSCAGLVLAWLALKQIGGQTGDVLGALEQIGEIVILSIASALLRTPLQP